MSKVNGVEIEYGPFQNNYLDYCIKSIDMVIDVHIIQGNQLFEAIKEVFDVIEEQGSKVKYIHYYPKELTILLGIKVKK